MPLLRPRHYDVERTLDPSIIFESDEDFIVMGEDLSGDLFGVDLRDGEPFHVYAGRPGSGKGYTLRPGFIGHAQAGDIQIIIEPKPGEMGVVEPFFAVAYAEEEITNALLWAATQRAQRQEEMQAWVDPQTNIKGVNHWKKLPGHRPRIILYLDEAGALLSPFSQFSKQARQLWLQTLGVIAQQGRSSCVVLRVNVQQANLSSFGGPDASPVRSALRGIICHGSQMDNIKALLQEDFPPVGYAAMQALRRGGPGRVVVCRRLRSTGWRLRHASACCRS